MTLYVEVMGPHMKPHVIDLISICYIYVIVRVHAGNFFTLFIVVYCSALLLCLEYVMAAYTNVIHRSCDMSRYTADC